MSGSSHACPSMRPKAGTCKCRWILIRTQHYCRACPGPEHSPENTNQMGLAAPLFVSQLAVPLHRVPLTPSLPRSAACAFASLHTAQRQPHDSVRPHIGSMHTQRCSMRWQVPIEVMAGVHAAAERERCAHLEGGRELLGILPASLNELQQLLGTVSGARHNRDQQLQRKSQVLRLYVTQFLSQIPWVLNWLISHKVCLLCNLSYCFVHAQLLKRLYSIAVTGVQRKSCNALFNKTSMQNVHVPQVHLMPCGFWMTYL